MSSARRMFVLLFTLLPLLAAQCWGLCGIPEKAHAKQPPCHQTAPDHSAPAPSSCCTATAAIAISADTDFNLSLDSALVATPAPVPVHEWNGPGHWTLIALHPPPQLNRHAILRI